MSSIINGQPSHTGQLRPTRLPAHLSGSVQSVDTAGCPLPKSIVMKVPGCRLSHSHTKLNSILPVGSDMNPSPSGLLISGTYSICFGQIFFC